MTINMANSSLASAYNSQSLFSSAKFSAKGASSAEKAAEEEKAAETKNSSVQQVSANRDSSAPSSTSAAELSEEEQKYDADGDGVLSATEQAAMLEAQATEKAAEASKNTAVNSFSAKAATLEISKEGYELYAQMLA